MNIWRSLNIYRLSFRDTFLPTPHHSKLLNKFRERERTKNCPFRTNSIQIAVYLLRTNKKKSSPLLNRFRKHAKSTKIVNVQWLFVLRYLPCNFNCASLRKPASGMVAVQLNGENSLSYLCLGEIFIFCSLVLLLLLFMRSWQIVA